jgi:5'-3' exonuclease
VSQLDLLSYVAPEPVIHRDIKPDNVAAALDYVRRRLLLIDGNNLACRAWYGSGRLPPVERFTGHVARLVKQVEPHATIVIFDGDGPGWRDEIWPKYKANRPPKPVGLVEHIVDCRRAAIHMRLVNATGIPNVEADDVIASYVTEAIRRDWETVIVTSDKDLLQLVRVDPEVTVLDPGPEGKRWDTSAVIAKFRVPARLIADLKALTGDTSDNYPGVPGLGPIRAAALLGRTRDRRVASRPREPGPQRETPPALARARRARADLQAPGDSRPRHQPAHPVSRSPTMTSQHNVTITNPPFVMPFEMETTEYRIVRSDRLHIEKFDGHDALGTPRWIEADLDEPVSKHISDPRFTIYDWLTAIVDVVAKEAATDIRSLEAEMDAWKKRALSAENRFFPHDKSLGQPTIIVINGRSVEAHSPSISYDDLLKYTGESHLSVTWKSTCPSRGSGMLSHGQSLAVETGLVINASRTGNA